MNNLKYTTFVVLFLSATALTAAPYKAVVVPDLGGKELLNFDKPMKAALSNYIYAIYKTSGNQRVYIRFNEPDVTFYPGIAGFAQLMTPPYPLVVTGYKGSTAGRIHIDPRKANQYPFIQALYHQPADSKIYAGGQRAYNSLTSVKNHLSISQEIPSSRAYTPDVVNNIIEQVKNALKEF